MDQQVVKVKLTAVRAKSMNHAHKYLAQANDKSPNWRSRSLASV
jgi:hypothetical protein